MTDQLITGIQMTVNEYMSLPESDERTELIEGTLIVSPAAKDIHEETVMRILEFLMSILPGYELRASSTDVHVDAINVLRPDVLWASAESGQCVRQDDGYLHGPPDLVVEVLSPATGARDRGIKFDVYEAAGVREYWLVDIDARFFEVYIRRESQFVRQGVYTESQTFDSALLNRTITVADLLPTL